MEYSLGMKDSTYDESSETKGLATHIACRFPMYMYHKIQNHLLENMSGKNEVIQDAVNVKKDFKTKFRLYIDCLV